MNTFQGHYCGSGSWQLSIILRKRFELTVFKRAWRSPSIEVRVTFDHIGIGGCFTWFGFLLCYHNKDKAYGYLEKMPEEIKEGANELGED